MALWDWIIEAITSPRQLDARAKTVSVAGRVHGSGGAVGTLVPPAETGGSPDEPDSVPWYAPEGVTLLEPVPMANPGLSHEGAALEKALTNQLEIN